MPSLLDPEAYGFANPDEDRRKKLSAQDVMSALGGLLSQPVDYVKGRATSLLTDPIGDIQRTLQGTVERAKARDLLTQQAYGDPSNPLRVTDQAAADQLANEYLDMASTIMPMGMVAPQASALAKAKAISGVDDPYTRSLQQGYEHDWYHGTTADIPSFDKGLLGETTGAQSAKKGFFFARDPQNPPASLTQKSSDPASIEMLKKLGMPDEEIAKLNSISMEGYGAETASGYANMGGSREYKEAMRKAKSAEKRGDWDEYAKQTEIAENAEISKSQELQSLVAKYGDARDEMLNDINNAYYGKKTYKLSQAEAEAMDAKYKQLMPYGWYNLYSVPQLKALKKEIANLSDVPEDSLKSIDKFISLKSERELAEKATEGGNVMPVALRYKNPMYHDFEGKAYREQTYNDLIQEAQQKGHDALILKNTYDPGAGPARLIDVGVVFEPNQIRSKFAAFDPSKINESNILAGALPFGLLSADEETKQRLRNLIGF